MTDIETYSDTATLRSRIDAAWSHLTEKQDSPQEVWISSNCDIVESDECQQTSYDDEPIDSACGTSPPTPSEDDWSSASEESSRP